MTRNFLSAFIAIPSIINIGRPIATILNILSNSEVYIWTKINYVENSGHYEIQDGRQKSNDQLL